MCPTVLPSTELRPTFSQVKAQYNNLVLQKLIKGIKPDVTAAIHQSIANNQKKKVQACVNYGLKNIQETAKQLGLE